MQSIGAKQSNNCRYMAHFRMKTYQH